MVELAQHQRPIGFSILLPRLLPNYRGRDETRTYGTVLLLVEF